ncbi:MAG TPA: 3-oxoacyl-[acyl-carrier-protein] synthase III C-terminal domain-containing protein [Polyangiaceae bacterium]
MSAGDTRTGEHVVLAGFRPVVLQRPVRQEVLLSYKAWLLATARCAAARTRSREEAADILAQAQAAVLRFGVSPRHIARRQFNVLPASESELGATGSAPVLPPAFADLAENPGGATLDRRMRDYGTLASRFFRTWYTDEPHAPEHVIHVTCSGYASPSAAQRWVSERGWHATNVTHCYHMGCYAAFPAIRMALGLLAPSILSRQGEKARVDVMHTEYLSAHFDPLLHEPGDIIDSTLFGDGFIGYSAYSERCWAELGVPGLRLLAQHEVLVPDTLDEMTWTLGPRHFEMYLSKNVPVLLERALLPFFRRLCEKAGRDFDAAKRNMIFAIHPGGPKILDHACASLALEETQIRHSRSVFHDLGNMSSATVPHVFERLLADDGVKPGTIIVAAAFGPGLTATGLVLEKIGTL